MHVSVSSICYLLLLIILTIVADNEICQPISSSTGNKIEINKVKLCRYRDEGLLPYEVFRYRSGEGCYSYFDNNWFADKIKVASFNMHYTNFSCHFPIGHQNGKVLLFDYKNSVYSEMIAESFRHPNYYENWKNCAQNADMCCNFTMNQYNVHPSSEYPCPSIWDAWSCFNMTTNGCTSKEACPAYITASGGTPCTLYSEKECFQNGTWNHTTNYIPCLTAPVYRRRHRFHVILLYISLVLSTPAVLIFMSYRNLRILRINLHRNLLIACLARNILTILTKELVILDALNPPKETSNILKENGIPCRILAYFNGVATNAIYACMLVDAFYLHKVIVRIFSEDPSMYTLYGITIILSFLPTTIWAILLGMKENQLCWIVASASYQWILDGFRIAILSANVILLMDVVRVLLMKLRRNVNPQHTKSTLKAIFFLIPLFGVPFIFTANRSIVDNHSCTAGDIYYFSSYIIHSFQSVMVATLFCYCNKEVRHHVERTYMRVKITMSERFALTKRKSGESRRDTATTCVQNQL